MKLTFLGACQMVTGSRTLVEHGETKLLVDCGMVQGEKFTDDVNYDPWPFDPATLTAVLLTHAHIDHCGRLPRLVRDGFKGKILATHATIDFAKLLLTDSAHVIASDAAAGGYPPLYSEVNVEQTAHLTVGVNYHQPTAVGEITAEWFDAGHILGSAFIRLTAGGQAVIFSGDVGNPPVPLLRPTEALPEADLIVLESTYGDRIHEPARERKLLLSSAIYETTSLGGTLLIPAFALERTQELLYELNDLVEHHDIPPLPIYIDSPLAIKATKLYPRYNQWFNRETQYLLQSGDDVFKFSGLHFTPTVVESRAISQVKPPKVIIAGSGMMQGGRVRYHAKLYLSDWRNQLLIVGYQVAGSLGRQLLTGDKTVAIDGEKINVKAKIRAIGAYSAHADQPKLIRWLQTAPRQPLVFLNHGELNRAQGLAQALQTLGYSVTIPASGQTQSI